MLPVDPLQLGEDRHRHAGDAVQGAGRWLVVHVLHDQPLPEVGEEPGTLAALRLARQDHRRRLRIQLGGAKGRGAGRRRVAIGTDPEVDGAYHRGVLQFLNLPKGRKKGWMIKRIKIKKKKKDGQTYSLTSNLLNVAAYLFPIEMLIFNMCKCLLALRIDCSAREKFVFFVKERLDGKTQESKVHGGKITDL